MAEDPTNENSAQQRTPPAINAIVKDILVPSALRTVFTMMTEEMTKKHTLTVRPQTHPQPER